MRNKVHTLRKSHNILVVPALIVATAFCFVFILMHPHRSNTDGAPASSRKSPETNHATTSISDFDLAPKPALSSVPDSANGNTGSTSTSQKPNNTVDSSPAAHTNQSSTSSAENGADKGNSSNLKLPTSVVKVLNAL